MRIRLKHRRLAALIAASALTQNHWALRLGLSRGHWSGLVNGNHPYPSIKTRTRILEAFGVAFEELFEIEQGGDAWMDLDFRRTIAERYIIDAEIGQGGMGAVYLARDVRHGRLVAIKVIASEAISGIGLTQFQREISTIAKLQHPNILPLYESGDITGQPFFVMPFVRGGSLRARLRERGRLMAHEAATLVRGITDALDVAHADRVLHCDIKPENILLHKQHAWLMDFGIARRLHSEGDAWPRRTELDTSAGTPAYVSPEQASGDPDIDARSDVYSLGCVVYEMLTGRSPFAGTNTQQIVSRRFIEPPPPLRDFAPDVPGAIEDVVSRAMALSRDRRYPGVEEFAGDFERALKPPSVVARMTHVAWRTVDRLQRTTKHSSPIGGLVRGFLNDLRSAWRVTRRNPGFSTLAALTIALGVAAVTSSFTILDTVLLKPLPYAHGDQLVLIRERTKTGAERVPSYPNFDDWRRRARSLSGIAAASSSPSRTVLIGNAPVRATALGVSRGFFRILGAPPVAGREFANDETVVTGPPVAMVSERFWRAQMNAASMPATIKFSDEAYTVIGVVPAYVQVLGTPDLYFPNDKFPGTVRSAHAYFVIARVADGLSIDAARAEMTDLSRAMAAEYGDATEAVDASVTPLVDYVVGNYSAMLPFVAGAAMIVLLIACVNVVSVNLARGLSRSRELSVRSALGASRARIVRQLLAESSLTVVGGVIAGCGVAYLIVSGVRRWGVGLLPRLSELAVDNRIMVFAIAVTLVCALLIGTYPALRLSLNAAGSAVRGPRDSQGTVRMPVWRILIGIQTALALILLVGSSLLVRTLQKILSADTGFDPHGVITVQMTPREGLDVDRMRDELRSLPGVQGVAFTNVLPLDWGSYSAPLLRPSDPVNRDWPALAGIRVVTPGYFEVLRQRLINGRTFGTGDRAGSQQVAILTRGAAERLWPGENAIGKRVATTYDTARFMEVVGVVEEASSWTMARGSQHEMYMPLSQWEMHARYQLSAVIRVDRPEHAIVPELRARFRDLLPDQAVRFGSLDRVIENSAVERRFAMMALAMFAMIALLLAAAGVYGVVSYSVATRRQEIGVRLALGATPGGMRRRVVLEALLMVGGGVGLGGVGAIFGTRYLRASLYGVTHLDPSAYAVSAAILIAAGFVGAYGPARRSSRVDPLIALRADG